MSKSYTDLRKHCETIKMTGIEGSEQGSLTTEYADDRFLTAREAGTYLSVPYQSILNMSSCGQLPYYKLGRRNRYLVSDLKQLLLAERRGLEGGAYGNKME